MTYSLIIFNVPLQVTSTNRKVLSPSETDDSARDRDGLPNDLKDVVGKSVPIASRIVGLTGGQILAVFRCTLQWDIEDD